MPSRTAEGTLEVEEEEKDLLNAASNTGNSCWQRKVLDIVKSLCSNLDGSISRNVDARLPGKENSTTHGATPVHQIITMSKSIRTSRLSIKNPLSL